MFLAITLGAYKFLRNEIIRESIKFVEQFFSLRIGFKWSIYNKMF